MKHLQDLILNKVNNKVKEQPEDEYEEVDDYEYDDEDDYEDEHGQWDAYV